MLRNIDTRSIPGITALSALSALVMTAWDVVMDPGMSLAQNWVWEKSGIYFGVPRHNYFGWLLTTFVVYWLAGWLWRADERKTAATMTFAALPVIVYPSSRCVMSPQITFPRFRSSRCFPWECPLLCP